MSKCPVGVWRLTGVEEQSVRVARPEVDGDLVVGGDDGHGAAAHRRQVVREELRARERGLRRVQDCKKEKNAILV